MNYIELINQFWKLDRERPFTATDTRLYFYLVHTCNTLGWKNPFGHSDRHLAHHISVSVNTIRKAKIRLIDAGLIDIASPEKPSNSLQGQTKYTILTVSKNDTVKQLSVSNNDTVCDTVCDIVCDTVSDTNIKLNQNERKGNIKNGFEVFQNTFAEKYPNVSKLKNQLTLAEYNAVNAEFSFTPNDWNNILQRMDNHKPLLEKNNSVHHTLRSWLLKDLKSKTDNATKIYNKTSEPNRKLTTNEGPTL